MSSTRRILVVEDEVSIAENIKSILEVGGYSSVLAHNPQDALSEIETQRPDLVLMDINLGADRDGIDVATELLKKHTMRVVYVTAYSDEEYLERAKKTEPLGYVVKPFDAKQLLTMVRISLHTNDLFEAQRAAAPAKAVSSGDGIDPAITGGPEKSGPTFTEEITGLPGRGAALSRIEVLKKISAQAFAIVLALPHFDRLKNRFGIAALGEVVQTYSMHIAQVLPPSLAVFVWEEGCFVVIYPTSDTNDVRNRASRLTSVTEKFFLQSAGRSALLSLVTVSTTLELTKMPVREIEHQIEHFARVQMHTA